MTRPDAFCVYRTFPPERDTPLAFDRHYLLYAAKGSMRLQAGGRVWSLPPARASWIAAGTPLRITIADDMLCCSALFAPAAFDAPAEPLTVFEMTPLARELILECRAWGPDSGPLPPDALLMFQTLAMLADRLASTPSPAWIASATSDAVRRAIGATESTLAEAADFDAIARAARMSPRTLARRFADELGMSWAQARRRLRMIRASETLATTALPVTEVALSVGYASSAAFNAAFRDFAGTTPTAFRASARP